MKKDKINRLKDHTFTRLILVLLGIGFIFLLWYLISWVIQNFILDDGVINIFFPGPEVVMPTFFRMLGDKDVYINIGYTLYRLIISFILSFTLAFICGTIAGLCKPFETFLKPLVVVTRTLPPAVLILSLLMFMRYDYSLFLIILMVMFPILYEAILSGYKNVDKNIIQALRIDTKIYRPNALFKVLIPSARPYIFLGVIQTLGLGLKVSIMAEVLLDSVNGYGIGIAFYCAKLDWKYDVMFSYSIYAVIIIGLFDLLLSKIKKRIKENM